MRRNAKAGGARDLTYANAARTRGGKAVIRLMEHATGRMRLLKRAQGFEADVNAGAGFFDVMMARYGLSLDVVSGALAAIPRDGPLIVIANHPYGILDGLVMGHVLGQARDDYKILANAVFARSGQLHDHLLPVSFEGTRAALALNLETRKAALAHLGQGGAIGVFPGGTVSTAARPFARPMDPEWRSFTARMVAKSGAVVVPLYFDGHTSRLFQIASHLHATLRMGLLIKEFRDRVDTPVRIAVGQPLSRAVLDPLAGDATAMMDFLRKATYELAPEPLECFDAGYDFEDRSKRR